MRSRLLAADVRYPLIVLLAAGLALLAPVVAAQPALGLAGRILDTTGAVVPGAAVVIRRSSGTPVGTVTSDATGDYQLAGLEPGVYTVTVSIQGFSVTQTDVTLAAASVRLDLTLRPGSLSEDLTVVGARLVGSEEVLGSVPGSYHVITQDTLRSAHVFSMSEALRKVPGVTVRDEEGLGLRPNIGLRGLNPTRSTKVLLLEDGLPTAFAPYGDNASYYHPPLERFNRIEVLKGSSQIAYGPVTLGGVINYITPDAPTRPSVSADFVGGTRGYANLSGSFGGTWHGTGVFLQALGKRSDGSRANVHSNLTDVMGKVSRSLGSTQQLAVKGSYYGEDSQVTYSGLREAEYRADPRQNPFANDVFKGDRQGASVSYRALAWSRVAFTGMAYTSRFARDWWRQSSNSSQRPNDAVDPQCGGMANLNSTCGNEGRLRRYRHGGAEARARVAFGDGADQETDVGLRLHAEHQNRRQENGETPNARSGRLVEDNERTTGAVSAFIQHRVRVGSWTATPGVRVERIRYTRTNHVASVAGEAALTEFVPGLGVAYGASPVTTIFGGVHRGFAPPRAEDLIDNSTGGVVNLEPERSWNFEAGGRSQVTGGLRLDAALFRLVYSNQIVPASLAGGLGALLTNGGETLQQGIELGADGEWPRLRGSAHGLYTRLAFTWLPIARFTGTRTSAVVGSSAVSVSGNRLPYAPETLSTVTLGYRHTRGADAQIESQYVGDQFGDDLNTVVGTADGQRGLIPAYTYWNLTLSWRIPRVGGSVFLAVKNLTGRTFIVDRARGILPSHPRLLQLGTSWRF